MANTYKILGQAYPGAASLTEAYAVPAATQAILSNITVCNLSATPTSFRIAVGIAGAAITNSQYIAYDYPIAANETVMFNEAGISLEETDTIDVYATLGTLAFNIFGVEIT